MKKWIKILIGFLITGGLVATAIIVPDTIAKKNKEEERKNQLKQEKEELIKNLSYFKEWMLNNSVILKWVKTYRNNAGETIQEVKYDFSELSKISVNSIFKNNLYYKNNPDYILSNIEYSYVLTKNAIGKKISELKWEIINPSFSPESSDWNTVIRDMYIYFFVKENMIWSPSAFFDEPTCSTDILTNQYFLESTLYTFDLYIENEIIKYELKNSLECNFNKIEYDCRKHVITNELLMPYVDEQNAGVIDFNKYSNKKELLISNWASRKKKENLIGSIMFIGNKTFSKKNVFARLIQESDLSKEYDELYYVY